MIRRVHGYTTYSFSFWSFLTSASLSCHCARPRVSTSLPLISPKGLPRAPTGVRTCLFHWIPQERCRTGGAELFLSLRAPFAPAGRKAVTGFICNPRSPPVRLAPIAHDRISARTAADYHEHAQFVDVASLDWLGRYSNGLSALTAMTTTHAGYTRMPDTLHLATFDVQNCTSTRPAAFCKMLLQ
ncbi:hypothetical protein CC80DRAFT_265650 [Byssothecium circinans]|uniref:Uncharacterized protein n=1 Tax=Byssothecium circinans TaxID=147558 RepID=A0A6A5UA68_9PLEO|nr:hypothetical protein CC80DRAFT_265650 [Byssothecium circinans]